MRAEMEVPLPTLEELPDGERAVLEGARRRRCAELLGNHCKKALAHITGHKVRGSRLLPACCRLPVAVPCPPPRPA